MTTAFPESRRVLQLLRHKLESLSDDQTTEKRGQTHHVVLSFDQLIIVVVDTLLPRVHTALQHEAHGKQARC